MEEHATLQARICAAWIDLLGRNRGAEGRPDQYYALSVENVRGHGEEFELWLTFRAGRTYCCCEDMCHTGVFTEKRWRQLRAALAVHGVEPHKPLLVRICTRLEAGARLHYGKSDEPESEVHDQGPWTLTVHEQSPRFQFITNDPRVDARYRSPERHKIADLSSTSGITRRDHPAPGQNRRAIERKAARCQGGEACGSFTNGFMR